MNPVGTRSRNTVGGLRRRALLGLGLAGLAGCASTGRPRGPELRFIGATALPHRMPFHGTTVGGLSGIDYDPAADVYYLLSDDRSDIQPARFFTARITLSERGIGIPQLLDAITLRQPDGTPYPNRRQGGTVADPESIRWRPQTGTLLWTSEGDGRLGLDPFMREIRTDGWHVREFILPPMFAMRATGTTGPRDNLTFEGLTLTPDGKQAWVAMEAALLEDGPVPTVSAPGGPCRFTLFDMVTGRAVRQVAYTPDPIPGPSIPPGTYADNGVSEILMVDARRMLVLERAYMTGVGNSLRLYMVDTSAASDTLTIATLRPDNHTPLRKTLVADFSKTGLPRLDNTEGMTWGPRLPSGQRTLVFVSDDNFNPAQITQFAAFAFIEQD